MQFFMSMNPPTTTAQQHRIGVSKAGRRFTFDGPDVKAARQKLRAHLALHAPDEPTKGALRLVVKWLFPTDRAERDGQYKTTIPDTDNLQKLLKDEMTKLGFWPDDRFVASEVVEKFWSFTPGIFIAVEPLSPPIRGNVYHDGSTATAPKTPNVV